MNTGNGKKRKKSHIFVMFEKRKRTEWLSEKNTNRLNSVDVRNIF